MSKKAKHKNEKALGFKLSIEVGNENLKLTMIDEMSKTWETVTYFKNELQTEEITIGTLSKTLLEVVAIKYREFAFKDTNLKNKPLNLN
ncbi:MAG TPA: hypothetical protein DIW31_12470 [Bacteroidales bacterium]|nr:hypothetical protein [Bacteroidales bacterium]